jgi:WD40 repeat protein
MRRKKPGVILLAICMMGLLITGLWMVISRSGTDLDRSGLIEPTEPFVMATEPQLTVGTPDQSAEDQLMGTLQAVADGGGEIYLIEGDQIESFFVSSDNIFYPSPVLSPDGTRIAFRNLDGFLTLYTISKQETTVYGDVDISGLAPLGWSPDGKQIVYSRSVAPSEICLYNLALAENYCYSEWNNDPIGSYGGYRFAGWSRNGEKMGVLFLAEPGVFEEGVKTHLLGSIYLLDLVDHSLTLVISEEGLTEIEHLSTAALSPDGQSFLFSASSGDFDSVYAVNADGTGLRRVTDGAYPSTLLNPVWSPDGKEFVVAVPAQGSEFDEGVYLLTIFDLSGQIVEQIQVENAQVSSWIN